MIYSFNFNVLTLKHTHWSAPRVRVYSQNRIFFPLSTHPDIFHWATTWGDEKSERKRHRVSFAFVLPDVKLTQSHTQTAGQCLSAVRSRWRQQRHPDATHTSSLISHTHTHTHRTKCKSLRWAKVCVQQKEKDMN